MATIYKRSDSINVISWRVQFRRSGYKSFSISLSSERDAVKFAREFEPLFVLNPHKFHEWKQRNYLTIRRMKEFYRWDNKILDELRR